MRPAVEVQTREGNAAPNRDSIGFVRRCEAALPGGVRVSHLWTDAASNRWRARRVR